MRRYGTLPQHQLARTLRQLREEAGLTQEEAAPELDWSTSKLGRIENAQQSVDVHGVRSMLDLYGVGGERWTEIIELVREARKKDRWHAYGRSDQGYVSLETDATVVHEYQLAYVPGLLVRSSDLSCATWRKSSRSNDGGGGSCVEVAGLRDEVALRDSKHPAGPVLTITRAEWCAFLGGVRASEFD